MCDGAGRLGCALGSVLARTSLLMKEWESDPDPKPNGWLWVEAILLGVTVLAAYLTVAYNLAAPFFCE